ncbi:hypothetical protein P171DRAFT_437692 [Karstenula rhodostoma CBS 690.94]|uniref:Uncharacterized protein n=1 Tax=Karstenula rhodostoma CBS 690.94 TaxID=1392251 RepID=A0A9P4P5F1_9PLEO|nr:hypothetical protein P171DRAFT_437692 [Karstenula rhodostoma CBS 690.94]
MAATTGDSGWPEGAASQHDFLLPMSFSDPFTPATMSFSDPFTPATMPLSIPSTPATRRLEMPHPTVSQHPSGHQHALLPSSPPDSWHATDRCDVHPLAVQLPHGADADDAEQSEDAMLYLVLEQLFTRPNVRQKLEKLRAQTIEWPAEVVDNVMLFASIVSSQGTARPPDSHSTRPGGQVRRRHITNPRGTTAEQWWKRFLLLRTRDVALSPSLAAQVANGPLHTLDLASSAPTYAAHDASYDASYSELFAQRLAFMIALESSSSVHQAVAICHCLFFSIVAAEPNPQRWTLQPRLARVSHDDLPELYTRFQHMLPGSFKHDFERNLRRWRTLGSQYTYLATQTSLGSLLHLIDLIQVPRMWGMSKGRESDTRVRKQALQHLGELDVVARAEASGADALMHGMLWELCGQFPHFPARRGTEPFPGLGESHVSDLGEEDYHDEGVSKGRWTR